MLVKSVKINVEFEDGTTVQMSASGITHISTMRELLDMTTAEGPPIYRSTGPVSLSLDAEHMSMEVNRDVG